MASQTKQKSTFLLTLALSALFLLSLFLLNSDFNFNIGSKAGSKGRYPQGSRPPRATATRPPVPLPSDFIGPAITLPDVPPPGFNN